MQLLDFPNSKQILLTKYSIIISFFLLLLAFFSFGDSVFKFNDSSEVWMHSTEKKESLKQEIVSEKLVSLCGVLYRLKMKLDRENVILALANVDGQKTVFTSLRIEFESRFAVTSFKSGERVNIFERNDGYILPQEIDTIMSWRTFHDKAYRRDFQMYGDPDSIYYYTFYLFCFCPKPANSANTDLDMTTHYLK